MDHKKMPHIITDFVSFVRWSNVTEIRFHVHVINFQEVCMEL
jgi:hypothetical protein